MNHQLSGFRIHSYNFLEQEREVFLRGDHGPAVVILSEIPGITPSVAAFASRVADAGYRVYMPQLFGTPGRDLTIPHALATMGKLCINREFNLLSADKSSPIIDWLRALARQAHIECGGPGVGVIGMCITGNFGLAMMLNSPVIAPVLSQPSLPAGFLPSQRQGLNISNDEIAAVHDKIDRNGARILGLRFKGDMWCPAQRFSRLKNEFGDAFESIEIDNQFARKGTGMPAHSVLTTHLIDEEGQPTREALDRTFEFLAEILKPKKANDAQ
jgi:dienelactone hydrolase